jgi:hypothetical protein
MVEAGRAPKNRVTRETRLLLFTVLLSLIALSVLARLRFPERPVSVSTVPLLPQFASTRIFDDLAADVLRLEPLVLPSIVPLSRPAADGPASRSVLPAFRFRDDVALVVVGREEAGALGDGADLVAHDGGSGLAVVRVAASPVPPVPLWTPQRLQTPRYFFVTSPLVDGISIRPMFVGSLHPVESPIWSATVWQLPVDVIVQPGTLVFTTAGMLAGLVAEEGRALVLVPGATVIAAAQRLVVFQEKTPGTLGIEVQALTSALAKATGAPSGVVVTWVDPDGPASGQITPTDVVEGLDGVSDVTVERWQARMARLGALDRVELRVRREGTSRTVALTAAPRVSPPEAPSLGLTLRTRARLGAEVVATEPLSIAAAAGLKSGDVITRIGEHPAPTAARVTSAIAALEPGGALPVAVTRDGVHLVVALVKP